MSHVTLSSGIQVSLDDPQPTQLGTVDIAISLSRTLRWGGCAPIDRMPLSVARHAVIVSHVAGQLCGCLDPLEAGLWGLLHDDHEAVTGDIRTPIKRLAGAAIDALEAKLDRARRRRFDMTGPGDYGPVVQRADRLVGRAEALADMAHNRAGWGLGDETCDLARQLVAAAPRYSWVADCIAYLERFRQCMGDSLAFRADEVAAIEAALGTLRAMPPPPVSAKPIQLAPDWRNSLDGLSAALRAAAVHADLHGGVAVVAADDLMAVAKALPDFGPNEVDTKAIAEAQVAIEAAMDSLREAERALDQ
jgi:5'-deoxynucleotidase YfbR-like HD superfamily hydrolase